MKRRDTRAALVVLALLIVGACQEDAPLAPGTAPTVMPDKYLGYTTGTCDYTLHNALQEILDNDDGVRWATIDGMIDRDFGGSISGTPAGWPEGYEVKLVVPAGAIPITYPPEVYFAIRVPVGCLYADPVIQRTSVPYRFYPDGMVFAEGKDATVTVCWPEWAGEPPANGHQLARIGTEVHENTTHFRVLETRSAGSLAITLGLDPALRDTDPVPWSVGITAQVHHFSRWEVVDDGDDPGRGGLLEELGIQVGDHCWTDNPIDPLDPRPLLR